MEDARTLTILASALQAVFESIDAVAGELPAERRAKVREPLQRIRQAKAEIMLRREELR